MRRVRRHYCDKNVITQENFKKVLRMSSSIIYYLKFVIIMIYVAICVLFIRWNWACAILFRDNDDDIFHL